MTAPPAGPGEGERSGGVVEAPRLVYRARTADGLWQVRRRPSALSVTRDVTTVFTFDGEGRPRSCLVDGVHHRRGLDGRVRARGIDGGPRRWLAAEEAESLWERVAASLRGLRQQVARDDDAGECLAALDLALAWDGARRAADVAAFRRLHTAVPILPPDRANALLVQVTTGCAWNRCTFCTLYRDRPYEVRQGEALARHLAAVRAFHGAGLRSRRHLFLGDANLLGVPPARLRPLVARVRAAFDEPEFAEMAGFADVLGARRHGDDDLRALRELGLGQIYLGLESGSDAVRQRLGKAGSAADAVATARRLRAAGLAVGAIVLLGAGGDDLRQEHLAATVQVLLEMELGPRDMVFCSPLLGVPPAQRRAQEEERESLQGELAPPESGGPRRALYDIEDFVY